MARERQSREGAAERYRAEHEYRLTPREEQILGLIALGYTQPEVAEKLGIGVETVKTYTKSARWLLRARNTTHAVAIAKDRGLI